VAKTTAIPLATGAYAMPAATGDVRWMQRRAQRPDEEFYPPTRKTARSDVRPSGGVDAGGGGARGVTAAREWTRRFYGAPAERIGAEIETWIRTRFAIEILKPAIFATPLRPNSVLSISKVVSNRAAVDAPFFII